MLFHSPEFIFFFLPTVLALFFVCQLFGGRKLILTVLIIASLFFYGWWNPVYLWVILGSVITNFGLAHVLGGGASRFWRMFALVIGMLANLGVLGYFKYASFLVGNLGVAMNTGWTLTSVALPLAISFFTFQQIAFLIDTYRRGSQPYSLLDYGLFVTFFPQLIAGPIVRHNELLPQFDRFGRGRADRRMLSRNVAIGATLFIIGLFKKLVLADGFAEFAIPVFNAADAGFALTAFVAWKGALAYALQLYFDFSGYCDMAIGLARFFGIVLPVNFDSPYKAVNLIEFWKRWHATLSRFLRDYLYIPLGGSRQGSFNHHRNIFITMVLCGVWHGAGWNFIVWGAMQGLFLNLNVAWRAFRRKVLHHDSGSETWLGLSISRALTFGSFVLGLVVFRTTTMAGSLAMYRAMFGLDLPPRFDGGGADLSHQAVSELLPHAMAWPAAATVLVSDQFLVYLAIALGLMICWLLPSSTSIAASLDSEQLNRARFYVLAVGVGVLAFIASLNFTHSQPSPFIYYQF